MIKLVQNITPIYKKKINLALEVLEDQSSISKNFIVTFLELQIEF